MSLDDYQVHNIYRYTRKSYKQNRSCAPDCTLDNSEEALTVQAEHSGEDVELVNHSPRSDNYALVPPGYLYELDTQRDLSLILHKKCPVITLAQQQLLRVLDETNQILARNSEENCSKLIRYLCLFKRLLLNHNKTNYVLVVFILAAFLAGLVLGAATCGAQHGTFNSPILNCIDNYFMSDSIRVEETFRCIA